MKKITLLLLIFGLVLTSCKKEKSEDETDQDLTGLIKTVKMNGSPIVEFSYYGNRKLKTKKNYQQGSQMTIEYKYADNKLSTQTEKYNGNIIAQYGFEYNNNRLTRVTIIGATNTYWEMQYNANGKIDTAIEYISGGESIKHTFTYNGQNLVEAYKFNRFGSIWELQSHMVFEYDSERNPYYDLNIPFSEVLDEFADFVSPNNFNRVKKYDQNNTLIEDTQYNISYNADDYPSHIEEVSGSSQLAYDLIYY